MGSSNTGGTPRVTILSSPGAGHLIPLVEFAKLLVEHHDLSVTLITFTDFSTPSQRALLTSLPSPSISSLSLPSLPLSDLPSDALAETRISVLVARSVPSLAALLQTLKASANIVAYVIDLFGGDTLPAARELHVPCYMFCTTNIFFLSFMFHFPTLDQTTACEFRDLPEPLRLPGCVPLRGEDFIDPLQDRSDEAYRVVVRIAKRFREVDGMLVNSFEAIEPDTCKYLTTASSQGESRGIPPVHPVGPVWRRAGPDRESLCLKWLDRQPPASVLFVSFGSGGTLSLEQTWELALGLEASRQRFLWVIRIPSDLGSAGTFLGARHEDSSPLDYLPEGFSSRIREFGIIVPDWAPQTAILGHAAVGGFLTHCGWNSTVESIMSGVPMIAWPLYAEQRMNAVMLVEGLKAALRPKANEKGLIAREEIGKVVSELMEGAEGEKARDKVRELREAGAKAWEKDEGSSFQALAEVVSKWKNGSAM